MTLTCVTVTVTTFLKKIRRKIIFPIIFLCGWRVAFFASQGSQHLLIFAFFRARGPRSQQLKNSNPSACICICRNMPDPLDLCLENHRFTPRRAPPAENRRGRRARGGARCAVWGARSSAEPERAPCCALPDSTPDLGAPTRPATRASHRPLHLLFRPRRSINNQQSSTSSMPLLRLRPKPPFISLYLHLYGSYILSEMYNP